VNHHALQFDQRFCMVFSSLDLEITVSAKDRLDRLRKIEILAVRLQVALREERETAENQVAEVESSIAEEERFQAAETPDEWRVPCPSDVGSMIQVRDTEDLEWVDRKLVAILVDMSPYKGTFVCHRRNKTEQNAPCYTWKFARIKKALPFNDQQFKVGDLVRICKPEMQCVFGLSYTDYYGKQGIVVKVECDPYRRLYTLDITNDYKFLEAYLRAVHTPRFKVGDRIRVCAPDESHFGNSWEDEWYVFDGMDGTITEVDPNHAEGVYYSTTVCSGSRFLEQYLEPLPEDSLLKVGDWVTVRKPEDPKGGWMIPDMDVFDGVSRRVTKFRGGGAKLEGCSDYVFLQAWLTKIDAPCGCK
jgi:hypothetical protein